MTITNEHELSNAKQLLHELEHEGQGIYDSYTRDLMYELNEAIYYYEMSLRRSMPKYLR